MERKTTRGRSSISPLLARISAAAYYGGETGGNGTTDNPAVSGPGPTGLPSGSLGGPDFYSRGGLGGTSFAAPTVAGGAALLYDAAYSVFAGNDDARDARVMKAVLMNSADKTVGWNNGQVSHPNGNGGVLTTQGLDNRVGTGRMNLAAAYDQFLTGTTDIAGTSSGNLGLVDDIGWDFGQVVSGTTNDYFFDSPLTGGSTFTATLTWFRDRRINASNTVFDDSYDDLNLELWSVVDGTPASLISESSSLYNESEHFSFALPVTGDYALRVRWFNEVFDRGRRCKSGVLRPGLVGRSQLSKRWQFPNRHRSSCSRWPRWLTARPDVRSADTGLAMNWLTSDHFAIDAGSCDCLSIFALSRSRVSTTRYHVRHVK